MPTTTTTMANITVVDTWSERDRQFVGLRDQATGKYILELWDEAVTEAVEDGFIPYNCGVDVCKFHKALTDWAGEIGASVTSPVILHGSPMTDIDEVC